MVLGGDPYRAQFHVSDSREVLAHRDGVGQMVNMSFVGDWFPSNAIPAKHLVASSIRIASSRRLATEDVIANSCDIPLVRRLYLSLFQEFSVSSPETEFYQSNHNSRPPPTLWRKLQTVVVRGQRELEVSAAIGE